MGTEDERRASAGGGNRKQRTDLHVIQNGASAPLVFIRRHEILFDN